MAPPKSQLDSHRPIPSPAGRPAMASAQKPLSGYAEKSDFAPEPAPSPVAVRKFKRKGKHDSLLGSLCSLIVDHQIGLSMNLLLLLFLAHITFPRARRRTRTFFELSYYDPSTGLYAQGWNDVPFLIFWIVVFTGLRAAIMDYILIPLATLGGIQKKRARVRFAEQAWLLIYYSIFWTLGMYIMYHTDYWFNNKAMWAHWPTRSMTGLLKWYYLVQLAYYLQQIFVVNIEERRKDFWQMLTHHILTSALMFMSYSYYMTKVGNAILCTMDLVDILLTAAKILKYLNFRTACDVMFGIFIVAWFVTRHIFYLMICHSVYKDLHVVAPHGCYDSGTGERVSDQANSSHMSHLFQAFRDPEGIVCFNQKIQSNFLAFLLALQGIALVWFWMIVKLAYKVISGQAAEDTRSDDEGVDDEEDELEELDAEITPQWNVSSLQSPLEEEVGVEGLNFARRGSPGVGTNVKGYRRNAARSGGGRASGISIPGHGDHKELLGRIGCDKPT